ncbi:MAG: hypothetical protein LLF76_14130 [Planctomycetaceae bacterium]|nr:hypothetical protein [Planctomycetaceae bacterium]
MIRNTFEILKARWQEAVLVVGLQTAMMLLYQEMVRQWGLDIGGTIDTPGWAQFLLGLGVIGLIIGWQMLFLGFLKTAATQGAARQDPGVLLKAGRPYLWQGLIARLLLEMAVWLVSSVMVYAYFVGTGKNDTAQLPGWFVETAVSLGTVILLKPFFLIPAFIVVLDLKFWESMMHARQVTLRDIKPLAKAVAVGFAAVTALAAALSFAPDAGPLYYAAAGLGHLARNVNALVLFTAASVWTAGVFLPPPLPEGDEQADM